MASGRVSATSPAPPNTHCGRSKVKNGAPGDIEIAHLAVGRVPHRDAGRLMSAVDKGRQQLHGGKPVDLETRDAKHEPRSLAEQRATWRGEAAAVLDGAEAVASMVRTALAPLAETTAIVDAPPGTSSPNSTLVPAPIGSITCLRHPRCLWPTGTGPVSEM